MIFIDYYSPLVGDIVHFNYDTHNEETTLGQDARFMTILKSSFYNPTYQKGLSFSGICQGIEKIFYEKRIIEAVIKRNNSYIHYTSPRYDTDFNYIGPSNDR